MMYDIVNRITFSRVIFRHSDRHVHLFPFVFGRSAYFSLAFIEPFYQIISVLKILVLQNNSEFISANPEYGTVFLFFLYQLAGCLQVNISLIMTVLIVDWFEVVTIKHHDREIKLLSVIKSFLDLLQTLVKTALVM